MSELPPGAPVGPVPSDDGSAGPPPTAGAPDWSALARVWAGEAAADAPDPATDAAARRWLSAHPDERDRLVALDRLAAAAVEGAAGVSGDAPPVDVEAALARVTARRRVAVDDAPVARPATPAGSPPRAPVPARGARTAPPRWGRRRFAGGTLAGGALAAAAVIAVAVGLARRRAGAPVEGTAVAAATPIRHTTPVGRVDSLRLADGTRVVLGPRQHPHSRR
jgi:hypothetical protein